MEPLKKEDLKGKVSVLIIYRDRLVRFLEDDPPEGIPDEAYKPVETGLYMLISPIILALGDFISGLRGEFVSLAIVKRELMKITNSEAYKLLLESKDDSIPVDACVEVMDEVLEFLTSKPIRSA